MSQVWDAMGDTCLPMRFELPATLDMKAASPLAQALVALRGRAVVVDAEPVQRLGGQCLQVLLAARRSWHADGLGFAIDAPSEPFLAALSLLGATRLLNPSKDVA